MNSLEIVSKFLVNSLKCLMTLLNDVTRLFIEFPKHWNDISTQCVQMSNPILEEYKGTIDMSSVELTCPVPYSKSNREPIDWH